MTMKMTFQPAHPSLHEDLIKQLAEEEKESVVATEESESNQREQELLAQMQELRDEHQRVQAEMQETISTMLEEKIAQQMSMNQLNLDKDKL